MLVPSGRVLGPFCNLLGPFARVLKSSGSFLGTFCTLLGPFARGLKSPGTVLGPFCTLLGPFVRVLKFPGMVLGPFCSILCPFGHYPRTADKTLVLLPLLWPRYSIFLFLPVTTCSLSKDETPLISFGLYGKIANSHFTLLFFGILTAIVVRFF